MNLDDKIDFKKIGQFFVNQLSNLINKFKSKPKPVKDSEPKPENMPMLHNEDDNKFVYYKDYNKEIKKRLIKQNKSVPKIKYIISGYTNEYNPSGINNDVYISGWTNYTSTNQKNNDL